MTELSRRELLLGAAALSAAALRTQKPAAPPAAPAPSAPPPVPEDATKLLGTPTSAVGTRSRFVAASRTPTGEVTGTSLTPLDDLTGTITPADLHFERHHSGVPLLDPARHTLTVHGLVERPMVFGLDDLRRFPQVTRVHFLECSGNGRSAWRDPKPNMTVQKIAGMLSNSEWTGVRLADLMREVGARADARWFLAEGGDACLLARSIPMDKAFDDALVVWAQNGEPLRPEQGYPIRLLLPGYEGNTNVKWLRRLELGTRPWLTRWETAKYTDPLPGGVARQFSFEMDAKSVITSPCTRRPPARGWNPISGIAWSGRGRITRVEVSTDAGATWREAELQGAPLPKALVRFERMWEWTGSEQVLLSRATDETGYRQPTHAQLLAVRGKGTDYHFNPIYGWRVGTNGQVTFQWDT
jgi:sulfane dehydrogenase subunit SoxC